MHQQRLFNPLSLVIVALGIALAFLVAAVPHYTSGYHLRGGLLLAGLLPYVIYGMAAAMRSDGPVAAGGLVILVPHALLVILKPATEAGTVAPPLYYGPLLLSLVALALLAWAMRTPWGLEKS